MNWDRDLPTWPLNALSRRITLGSHRWHVQESGTGDLLLLLHGAGATTHSWRDVIPRLASSFHVVALDLPGQGFTQVSRRGRNGLQAMTQDVFALCKSEGWTPRAIIGHSAGAAVALDLARAFAAESTPPPSVIGMNAALGRFEGVAGWLFPLLAKVLALNPLTSYLFAAGRHGTKRARRLIEGTGSVISDEGLALYGRLVSDRDHVEGTLQMMAQWQIDDLLDNLASHPSDCLFLVGGKDKAVKPEISQRAATMMRHAQVQDFPDLGHLAHEEQPSEIVEAITGWLAKSAVGEK